VADFWDIAPCSLVDTNRRLSGAYFLVTRFVTIRSSLSPVNICQTIQHNVPESGLFFLNEQFSSMSDKHSDV
jgi:hypothetical protein